MLNEIKFVLKILFTIAMFRALLCFSTNIGNANTRGLASVMGHDILDLLGNLVLTLVHCITL